MTRYAQRVAPQSDQLLVASGQPSKARVLCKVALDRPASGHETFLCVYQPDDLQLDAMRLRVLVQLAGHL